jgi:quercetin dioxygenase-like cupin family protein
MRKPTTVAFLVALTIAAAAVAQQAGIKRTILQRVDVPSSNYETVLGIAEIAAGINAGRHTHPGPETGTVTEGEMVLLIDGQPPKTLKVGDSYQIATGVVHDVKAVSGAKVVADCDAADIGATSALVRSERSPVPIEGGVCREAAVRVNTPK